MKIGFFGINVGPAVDAVVDIARAAEAAGLESVWTGEHVVLPDPQAPPSPSPPQTPFLDPLIALTAIASATSTLKLGTGIVILPQRNPVVLAKEVASLDVVSDGRLILGIGAGYLEPEFRAIGAPFENRGAATDEWIQVLKALWTMEEPSHHGRYFSFEGIDAQPRPVQKPHPPIVVGGHTRRAARRAARYGNGWYGFMTNAERTARTIGWIEGFVQQGERPADLGPLEYSVTPPHRMSDEVIDRYGAIGVHRLIPLTPAASSSEIVGFIEGLTAFSRGRVSPAG